ncbi:hypothetical protein AAF712_000224 [Marasmius tenuissimus]|uniref:Uncharacterized protein n=1 Tax=Marasmius tenuissimus TaxID=585030 RepID=A0ABR3AEZ4_9AGAR
MWPFGSSSSATTPEIAKVPETTKITTPEPTTATTPSYFESIVQEELAYLRKVHPTVEETPTCLNLFDTYLGCNAIRSQVKSYYRYGSSPSSSPFPCGPKLEDWKFCMGLKWSEPEERREMWLRRRAEWWARRRVEGKSSEDVWELRRDSAGLGGEYPRPLTEKDLEMLTHEGGEMF